MPFAQTKRARREQSPKSSSFIRNPDPNPDFDFNPDFDINININPNINPDP